MTTQKHPDRIDFTEMHDGRVIVLELRHDVTDPARPRDIPLPDGHRIHPAGFDLDAALDWCRANGYTVRRIPGSARAWLGDKPWPVRSRHSINLKRQEADRLRRDFMVDFAYDG